MKKIISVVGARPNFIKIAPFHRAICKFQPDFQNLICHTGQHFDKNMSAIFFEELDLPRPDFYLGVGSGTHADQTARIMIEFEKVLMKGKPDLVVVPGDVNSTMACSLVAAKLGIRLAHIEAGLRSFDHNMPEEINRVITDVLSDLLFVSEPSGLINLRKEGISQDRIFHVGNIMIDSLIDFLPKIEKSKIREELKLEERQYVLVTFHRPNNVDEADSLKALITLLNHLSKYRKVVFPVHPRTRNHLKEFNLVKKILPGILLLDPVGYIDFLHLTKYAELVITDSGGIQEETTYLGIPCLTVRDNTERPVTVTVGTNQLIGTNFHEVEKAAMKVLGGKAKKGTVPDLWDGKTAERIASVIVQKLL